VEDWSVLLLDTIKPDLTCREAGTSVQECIACARGAVAHFRQGWLRAIGAPDYRAYLAHQAQRHPGVPPMSERDYVNTFIERRYGGSGAGRCC
jgi:uncharacterized short protein YbdD (DUF466 family)